MIYVMDSSFIAALIIPDEKSKLVDKMYDKIQNNDEKHIPCLFWYEISNVCRSLLRRRRYTMDEIMLFFPRLAAFRLTCDYEAGIDYSGKLLRLCDDCGLSSYDAAYLELARRKKAILCTLDENLRAAAKNYGVAILK